MDINTWIYGGIFLVQVISTGILLKHKNNIIKDLQHVMEVTDIKRLTVFYEKLDELTKAHAIAVTKKALDAALQDFESKIGAQYNEMATFINGVYLTVKALDEEDAKEFLANHFPNSQHLFPYKGSARDDLFHSVHGE